MHPTRLRPLTAGELAAHCPDGARPELDALLPDAPAHWAVEATEAWGMAGLGVVRDGRCEALALLCQGLQLPAAHPLLHFGRQSDAAYLLALAGDQELEAAHARQLVQGLARRLAGQVACLEVVGSWRHARAMTPAVGVLEAAGFHCLEERRDGLCRMVLELERTVRWRPDVNQAWQALAGLVPRPCPPSATRRGGLVEGAGPGRRQQ